VFVALQFATLPVTGVHGRSCEQLAASRAGLTIACACQPSLCVGMPLFWDGFLRKVGGMQVQHALMQIRIPARTPWKHAK
jgi:hypothetical protein